MLSLCSHCSAIISENTATCPRCGRPARAPREEPAISIDNDSTSERREATVVFCDLGGYTAWNEEAEPEEVVAVMDRIRRKAVSTFESYGGIANQFVGDEVLGLFGVVSSHPDDPCRAVEAALALHAFVREQKAVRAGGEPRILRMHTGIETGTVYARIRDPRSGVYEVTGDPVNTAARLRSMASTDEILVGPTAQRRIEPFYALHELDPATLRGKAKPVVAHRVSGRSASISFFDVAKARGLTRYVGRVDELQHLRHAWEEARRSRGSLVAAAGPPGIGKTRLLYELRKEVLSRSDEKPSVLHGRCSAYGDVAPYQPFIDAIRGFLQSDLEPTEGGGGTLGALESLAPLSEDTERVIGVLLAPSGSHQSTAPKERGELLRDATIDALCQLMISAAATTPVLIVFEDWQWADEASRAALRQLADRAKDKRVLIAINYRPGELAEQARPSADLEIELSSFDSATTEALARAALRATTLPPELSKFIHERTHGNAFFVEEICRSLLDRGVIARESGSLVLRQPLGPLATPATVQSIVRARVDRLSAQHKDLLRIAAVIGSEFTLDLLEPLVTGRPRDAEPESTDRIGGDTDAKLVTDVSGILDELENQGLTYRTGSTKAGTYRFKHSITQEVVYEGMPLPDRRQCHEFLAELIETRTDPESRESFYETLAHHYRLSSRRDKALEYAVLAADKAWQSFSLEQADRQYKLAIELLTGLRPLSGDRKRRHIDVSLSWARTGIYNPSRAQIAALEQSLRWAHELSDTRRVCLCLNWLSWIEYALGNYSATVQHGRAFLDCAKTLNHPGSVSQALTNLGLAHTMAASYTEALDSIESGIRTRGRYAGTAYGYALGYLALIRGDQGDFDSAYAHIEEATPIAHAAGRLTLQGPLLIQRGMVECWQGAFDACIETAREAHRIAERIEGKYILAMSLALDGYARYVTNRDLDALARLRASAAMLEGLAVRLHMSWILGLLAEASALAGNYDEAMAAAHRTLRRAGDCDRTGEAMAWRVRGVVASRRDADATEADHCMRQALEAARRKDSPRETALTKLCWAELLAERGNRPRALELIGEAQGPLDQMGLVFHANRGRQFLERLQGRGR